MEYKEKLKASYHQERLWSNECTDISISNQNTSYYNIPVLLELEGGFDFQQLNDALLETLNGVEIFRTRFIENEQHKIEVTIGAPYQNQLLVEQANTIQEAKERALALSLNSFKFLEEQLVRYVLYDIQFKEKALLVVVIHHAIFDKVSVRLFVDSLTNAYHKIKEKVTQTSYYNFATWQRKLPQNTIDNLFTFWKRKLERRYTTSALFRTQYQHPESVNSVQNLNIKIKGTTYNTIKDYLKQGSHKPEDIFLTVYQLLLSKYSRQKEVACGVITENRQVKGTENIVGPLANILPINIDIKNDELFFDLAQKIASTLKNNRKYEALPLEVLATKMNKKENEFFNAVFHYQDDIVKKKLNESCIIKQHETNRGWGRYDLNLLVQEDKFAKEYNLLMSYDLTYYPTTLINRFLEHFKVLLKAVCLDDTQKVCSYPYIPIEEEQSIIEDFNATASPMIEAITIQELIELQALKNPEVIALEYKGAFTTYAELNTLANQLAHYLITNHSISSGKVVGVCSNRSDTLLIGILGVLKAGGAYLPIDPKLPKERILYMLDESDSNIVLTHTEVVDSLLEYRGSLFLLDKDIQKLSTSTVNVGLVNKEEDAAYIIYTSGSTGKPKGVVVGHRSLLNYIGWASSQYLKEGEDSVFALYTSLSFDLTITSIFTPLISGNRIVIYEEDEHELLVEKVFSEGIATVIKLTPSHLKILRDSNSIIAKEKTLTLIVGGEPLDRSLASSIYKKFGGKVKIYNEYGPTEATVGCMIHEYREDGVEQSIPIGLPIANTQVYLLDDDKRIVPSGVWGELYISGVCLAKGYLNNKELTEERFPVHFLKEGERMYKTGDKAVRLEDGTLLFRGRIDNQIKIRGYRIELGEIENAMSQIPNVKDTFACVRGENDEHLLYGYYIASQKINVKEFKNKLRELLPEYSIPDVIIEVESFKMTINGKRDKEALPLQEEKSEAFLYPKTEIENKVLELFSEILKRTPEEISISKSFYDLGGHSLAAIRLLVKVKNNFKVSIPVPQFFDNSSVAELSVLIANASTEEIGFKKAEKKEYYPLAPSQKRLYILQKMNEEALLYNITSIYSIEQHIEIARIQDALNKLMVRHEALRTSFVLWNDSPMQHIANSVKIELEEITCDEKEIKSTVEKWIRPFKLEEAPLMRAGILTTTLGSRYFILDIHHIITDGVSNAIYIEDFVKLYKGEILPEIKLHFKDFSEWQNSEDFKLSIQKSEQFWLNKFEEELPIINLPLDYGRPIIKGFDGNSIDFNIDKESSEKIMKVAKDLAITPFNFMLGVYFVLLRKITGQEDIVIGSPSSGRSLDGLHNTTGVFINVLAHRNYPKGNKRFKDFLKSLNVDTLQAFDHQDYQFEKLVDKIVKIRDTSRNPLFDVMFDYHNEENQESKIEVDGIKKVTEEIGFVKNTAMFDLNWHVYETENGFRCNLDYSAQLFRHETVVKLVAMIKNIINEVSNFPSQDIALINVIGEEERSQVLYGFNDTSLPYEETLLIHQSFERRVLQQPDAIAVICKNKSITYKELNEFSNKIAYALMDKGLRIEDYVGITMDRSIEMLAAVLGVLKAGGIYVPIEPYLPDGRIETLTELLTIQYFATSLSQTNRITAIASKYEDKKTIFSIVNDNQESTSLSKTAVIITPNSNYSKLNPIPRITSENHAYIIFTSGSTGTPKGVIVKHKPVINILHWVNRELKVTTKDKLLFVTSLGFDLSVYDIFGVLDAGATIRIATRNELSSPENILEIIVKENITIWDSAPAALQQLIPVIQEKETYQSKLRLVMLSGDWIPVALPGILSENFSCCNVVSLGGATEATIWSNYFKIKEVKKDWVSIPYGKPIQNAKYYILDQYYQPCPIGIPGDLYIGGECLASGYVGDLELTNKKFINDPFNPGKKMYMTGDTARWFEDGNMEFLGRKDNQVKIRGHRIELGEIESCFSKYTTLAEFLAIPVQIGTSNTDKQLCVYYVAKNEIDKEEVKEKMANDIPAYMIPTFFVRLDEFPVNQNGKVNRKALPVPTKHMERNGVEVELDVIDEKIIQFCAEILNTPVEQIDIRDNFFDLGGHSLNSTSLLNKVNTVFGVKVPLIDFFRQKNLTELSEYVRMKTEKVTNELLITPQKTYYNLSSSQKRLFILHELDAENIGHSFNIPIVLGIKGSLDIEKVEKIFKKLITRHESLRTSFHIVDNIPVQQIHGEVLFHIKKVNVSIVDEIIPAVKNFVYAFDLHKPPLLRVGVVFHKEIPKALVIDMHHIVSDGVSQQLLIKEFMDLYTDINTILPNLKYQYKDYAEWQFKEKMSDRYNVIQEFWVNQFSDAPQYLKLPTDFSRGNNRDYNGKTISFMIPKRQTESLYNLTRITEGTLFTTLLGIINVLLSKLSGQNEITIGTVTSGRTLESMESIVGFFLNTLALRNFPKSEITLQEFLIEVKENTLNAFDHQEYQYEDLVNALKMDRSINQNPLFNTVFILQNMENIELKIPDLEFEILDYGYDVSKMDLTFVCTEKEEGLHFDLEYSTALFKEETIQRFIKYFKRIITQVIDQPTISLGNIDVLDIAERNEILYTFNDTKKNIEKDICYHELFEEQVKKYPKKIAARYNETTITYETLNITANRIANYLIDLGVKEGEVIGISFERNLELLAAILGVLKTGASYVAIDHEYPMSRVKEILKQSESRHVIVQQMLADDYITLLEEIPMLETILSASSNTEFEEKLNEYSVHNPGLHFHYNTTAYIIYTSGTTGIPKGIMIHQLGMLNHMYGLISKLHINEQDIMAQTASCSSDIFVVQLLLTLITGGSISILDKDDILDPRRLFTKIKEDKITMMEIVPSLLTAFLDAMDNEVEHNLPDFRAILSMGEALKPSLAKKWFELYPDIALYNAYGPAEASDDVSLYRVIPELVKEERQIPIGYPLENVHIYIMDEKLNLCPVGVLGEICISGIAVGKGYWKDEEKTMKVFVENPMYKFIQDEDYKILYKTGDLGFWQADGTLVFDSRKDHMVKIRGFRVEPGDIENAMLQIEEIKEVTVIDHQYENGTKYLCAYFTGSRVLDITLLRSKLLEVLPNYMLPSYFIQLESIPITASDKVDRKALPIPDIDNKSIDASKIIAPVSSTESILVSIWKTILGIEAISTDHGFFYYGGDSIKAINLQSLMRSKGIEVSIKEIYQYNTIKDLAAKIDSRGIVEKQKLSYSFYQQQYFELIKDAFNEAIQIHTLSLFKPLSIEECKSIKDYLKQENPSLNIGHEDFMNGYFDNNQKSDRIEIIYSVENEKQDFYEVLSKLQSTIDFHKTTLVLAYVKIKNRQQLSLITHTLLLGTPSVQKLIANIDSFIENTEKKFNHNTAQYYKKCQEFRDAISIPVRTISSQSELQLIEKNNYFNKVHEKLSYQDIEEITSILNGNSKETLIGLLCLAIQKQLKENTVIVVKEEELNNKDTDEFYSGQFTHYLNFLRNKKEVSNTLNAIIEIRNEYRKATEIKNKIEHLKSNEKLPKVLINFKEENTSVYKNFLVDSSQINKSILGYKDMILIEVEVDENDTNILVSLYDFLKGEKSYLEPIMKHVREELHNLLQEGKMLKQPVVTSSDFDYKELSEEDLDSIFDL